jgi:hypothetical protein
MMTKTGDNDDDANDGCSQQQLIVLRVDRAAQMKHETTWIT